LIFNLNLGIFEEEICTCQLSLGPLGRQRFPPSVVMERKPRYGIKNTLENVSYNFCCRISEINKLLITLSLIPNTLIVLLQMTNNVKDEFRKNQYTNDGASTPKAALTRETKRGSGAATGTKAGQQVHFALNNSIKNQSEKLTPQLREAAKDIEKEAELCLQNYEKSKSKEEIKNDNPNPKNDNPKEQWELELLQSEFSLAGYMIREIKNERPEIYYWKGDADVIGWYKDNYVIIDWKVVDAPKFWEEHSNAYGKHLHQCLVYAWLLKLNLELPKLPYILIVPIDESTQKVIEPGLFYGFPKECTDKLDEYKWSTTFDQSKLKVPMSLPRDLIHDNVKPDVNDCVNTGMKLENLFTPGCTLEKLLNALRRSVLKIEQ
jgi:hypothetical protein